MKTLRAAAGFAAGEQEALAMMRGGEKLALAWEQQEGARLVYDKTSGRKRLLSRHVRRTPLGKIVGEVKQVGTLAEWTAEGLAARASEHLHLGKIRTAPSLLAAMVDVDAHLEANGWTLWGRLVLSRIMDDEE